MLSSHISIVSHSALCRFLWFRLFCFVLLCCVIFCFGGIKPPWGGLITPKGVVLTREGGFIPHEGWLYPPKGWFYPPKGVVLSPIKVGIKPPRVVLRVVLSPIWGWFYARDHSLIVAMVHPTRRHTQASAPLDPTPAPHRTTTLSSRAKYMRGTDHTTQGHTMSHPIIYAASRHQMGATPLGNQGLGGVWAWGLAGAPHTTPFISTTLNETDLKPNPAMEIKKQYDTRWGCRQRLR